MISHGNTKGRKALIEILEAGIQAADPYFNTKKLIQIKGKKLIIGNKNFGIYCNPKIGEEEFDLDKIGKIYVFGAGKGIQQIAKAIEDVLGNRLTGGHVIDKKGSEIILDKISVTFGGHPIPDEDCIEGSKKILKMTGNFQKEDLVFTITTNGISSLLTMPVDKVSLEDVRKTTYIMQIEHGAPTKDLNSIRNHLDKMKGGKISTRIYPAIAIHIIALDPDYVTELYNNNYWLHTLPDNTTFQDAIKMLKKWDAWNCIPTTVKRYLEKADSKDETVKLNDFKKMRYWVFGIMPEKTGMISAAKKKAKELGFKPITLAKGLQVEASQAGLTIAAIARTIENISQPFEPPCALFTDGELLVTVGKEKGIGGRNQEFVLSASLAIAGSKRIVMGAVDSDGTDGPGDQFLENTKIPTLAGGITDGDTVARAKEMGIDIYNELKRHNSTPALWKLNNGILATPNISMNDLSVALIL